MTVTVQVSHQVETPVADLPRTWTRERRTAVGLMAIGVLAAVGFGLLAGDKPVRFTFGETTSGSGVTLDPVVGTVGLGLLGAVIAVSLWCAGWLLFWVGYRKALIWRAPGFD